MSAQARQLKWCVTHGSHVLYHDTGLCDFAHGLPLESCEVVPAVLVTDVTSSGWTGKRLTTRHHEDAVCIR